MSRASCCGVASAAASASAESAEAMGADCSRERNGAPPSSAAAQAPGLSEAEGSSPTLENAGAERLRASRRGRRRSVRDRAPPALLQAEKDEDLALAGGERLERLADDRARTVDLHAADVDHLRAHGHPGLIARDEQVADFDRRLGRVDANLDPAGGGDLRL